MIGLVILGGVVALIGGIIVLVNLKNFRRRQRILATPTSPIAQASGQGPVEIQGRIVPSEQGLVQTPFSGKHAVWTRITVQELRSSGRSSHWHTVLTEADGRPFFVDDGSGQTARVLPQGANVILDKQCVASSGTFNDAPAHLEQFLASRGLKSQGLLGFNKSMRYEEALLAPGDDLYAIGPSRRDAGPPVHDGYRMAPSSQLILFMAGGAEAGELILTNKSEQQLVSKLMTGFIAGLVVLGIGALMSIGGVALVALELMVE